jgi:hypothetical protein
MKTIIRLLMAVLFIIAALSSYSFGNQTGSFIFIILGFLFETAFWLNLFPIKKKKKGC